MEPVEYQERVIRQVRQACLHSTSSVSGQTSANTPWPYWIAGARVSDIPRRKKLEL